MFICDDKIYCLCCSPECITTKRGIKVNRRPILEIVERNYSGTRLDIYSCPKCGKFFQVSYRINKVEMLEDWGKDD
jgi:hypothetical protein